jgi:hypothetical protein
MTAAGRIVELARYRIPAGERALQAQRIDGRVAVIDVPVTTTTANATSKARPTSTAPPPNTQSTAKRSAGPPRLPAAASPSSSPRSS